MERNTASSDLGFSGDDTVTSVIGGIGHGSMGDRFKQRNPNPTTGLNDDNDARERAKTDRRGNRPGRSGHRKFILFPFRGRSFFYFCVFFVVFTFALASMVLQSSITPVFRNGSESGTLVREDLKFGSSLKFVLWRKKRRFELRGGLEKP